MCYHYFPQSVMVLSPSCPLYPPMWFCPMQMLEWGQSMLPHSGCCLTQHLSIHVSEKTWNRFQGHPVRWEKQDSFSSFSPPTAFSVSMCLFFRTVITGWLRAAEIYFLTVEEARGLKSKCWQSWLEETKIEKDTCTPAFIAALLTVARVWKQPRCLSIDEWIKKLWYIYTMEYYSAIKRNTSVLMRWMNLEPIIPSVVSQKKKNKYRVWCTYMESLSCVRLLVTPWTCGRLLCPWDSPGKNTGVGCHSLLQRIFPT